MASNDDPVSPIQKVAVLALGSLIVAFAFTVVQGADRDVADSDDIPGGADSTGSETQYFARFERSGQRLQACMEFEVFKEGTSLQRWTEVTNAGLQPPESGIVRLEKPCRHQFASDEILGPCDKWTQEPGEIVMRGRVYFGKALIEADDSLMKDYAGNYQSAAAAACVDDHGIWRGGG